MIEDLLETWRVHDEINFFLLAMKQSGIRMPDEARFGIWEHWFRPKLKVLSGN